MKLSASSRTNSRLPVSSSPLLALPKMPSSTSARLCARDSRRPMSRNDQPKLRVMFSCVRPWKAASTRRPSSSSRNESPMAVGMASARQRRLA